MSDRENFKKRIKVLPIEDLLVLPGIEYEFKLYGKAGENIHYENLKDDENILALPLRKNFQMSGLRAEDFYSIGTEVYISNVTRKDRTYYINARGLQRVMIDNILFEDNEILAEYFPLKEKIDLSEDNQNELLSSMKKVTGDISRYFKVSEKYVKYLDEIGDINEFIGEVSKYLPLKPHEKQELLSFDSLKERAFRFSDHLIKQRETLKFQMEIAEKFSKKQNKAYRESMLREQLKAIKGELKESKSGKSESYEEKIENSAMPDDVKKVASEEMDKLENLNSNSPEYSVTKNYLDFLISMPWDKNSEHEIDLKESKKILDNDHYGLKKVKERIIQHLAVMKLKNDNSGSIILLVGPPGTGKTSLGKSIAKALNREYIRISLGGIRDEADIRGHRRTYIGSMPGRIIKGIKRASVSNPVFVLDEVDKIFASYNGDPASALLEVLDPEQNNSFTDHYLEVPYDLSKVFFIATANSISSIPSPLLDRMEVVNVSSYTSNEKFQIAKRHLINGVLEEHGITSDQLIISDEAIKDVIENYTLESGVRELKRQLAKIARVVSTKIVSNEVNLPYTVTGDMLEDILGRQVSKHEIANMDNPPGVVTGLAWTSVGGEILFIEGTHMPGNGKLVLTGNLGDVMKESAKIALSLVKSRLTINTLQFDYKEKDIHIHVPSGAVPKDGPSAGIALTTAIASLVTGIKVNSKLAMTGEITLRGAVTQIGGLKEKLLAAHRAGIKNVLIPKENEKDLKDMPAEIKNELNILPVETIEEVFAEALGLSIPKAEIMGLSNSSFDLPKK